MLKKNKAKVRKGKVLMVKQNSLPSTDIHISLI